MTQVYSGVWRMEDDCLRLDLSASVGTSLSGSFQSLISPSGEECIFSARAAAREFPFCRTA